MARVQTISTEVKEAYKIRKASFYYLELPVESIPTTRIGEIPSVIMPNIDAVSYTPLGKYQTSRRDLAMIVPTTISADDIQSFIRQFNLLIIDAELFDTYTDPKIGLDSVSYAFHIVYQSIERTLTNEEINHIHGQLETKLKEQFHATIR
jgi:phenylalanyl-tRNA synthetase beta subunit